LEVEDLSANPMYQASEEPASKEKIKDLSELVGDARIRQMMIDFLAPYLKSVGKLREQIDYLKNFQFNDRSRLEELQHQLVRFKRYDEFFAECNRKINSHEAEIRNVEKKLQEEINAVENKK
jgi:predicted RNase H-like nuclease (RuvC/YqgF family)